MTATLPPTGSWYFEKQKGGGALFDQGAHAADLFLHFFGNGKITSANFVAAENKSVDIAANAKIQFKANLSGSIDIDWRSRSLSEVTVTAEGKDAFLSADLTKSTLSVRRQQSILGRRTNGFTMLYDEKVGPHRMEIWEFVRSVRIGKESTTLATGQDGLNALQLIESAYQYFPKVSV